MSRSILTAFLILATGQAPTTPKPAAEPLQPDPAWKELGRSLWFDREHKQVVLKARVVLRDGILEHLMCRKGTKEHEAILATDASAVQIHAALLAAGAKQGTPVQFAPTFEPPSGTTIAIDLKWRQDGKLKTTDARQWVRDEKTKKPLDIQWVFAGSVLYKDPVSKKTLYAAEDGDYITVANFASAILDLPMASSANDADRMFMANTDVIPPLGTEVLVTLRPVEDDGKAKPSRKGKAARPRTPAPPRD